MNRLKVATASAIFALFVSVQTPLPTKLVVSSCFTDIATSVRLLLANAGGPLIASNLYDVVSIDALSGDRREVGG